VRLRLHEKPALRVALVGQFLASDPTPTVMRCGGPPLVMMTWTILGSWHLTGVSSALRRSVGVAFGGQPRFTDQDRATALDASVDVL
jgi:hypothetical protein